MIWLVFAYIFIGPARIFFWKNQNFLERGIDKNSPGRASIEPKDDSHVGGR
jgi:hypothetical protein